jgi:hypothetical protein
MADKGGTSMNLNMLRRVILVAVMLLAVAGLGLAGCASTDEASSYSGDSSNIDEEVLG